MASDFLAQTLASAQRSATTIRTSNQAHDIIVLCETRKITLFNASVAMDINMYWLFKNN